MGLVGPLLVVHLQYETAALSINLRKKNRDLKDFYTTGKISREYAIRSVGR
jgi:hypothetical protein